MDDQPELLDLNTASQEELTTIPGIDQAMAEQIVAERPFTTLDDLQRLSGINPAVLERLTLFATVTNTPEQSEAVEEPVVEPGLVKPGETQTPVIAAPAPESASPAVEDEPASQPTATPARAPAVTPLNETPPAYATRFQALWIALASSVITLLLALFFALGLLTMLNGGLRYANPEQVSRLGLEMQGVNAELGILKQDMDAVRTRLGNLEGLSGRVNGVEKAAATLRRDVDAATNRLDQLDRRANELTSRLEEMQTRTTRFEDFLNRLREMLNGLLRP